MLTLLFMLWLASGFLLLALSLHWLFIQALWLISPGEAPQNPTWLWQAKRACWRLVFAALWWLTETDPVADFKRRYLRGYKKLPAWVHFNPHPNNPKRCWCGRCLWHPAENFAQALERMDKLNRGIPRA